MRKGVIYPPADNQSNARYSYYGRLQYEPILSQILSEDAYKRHIDLIFKRPLYGKMNTKAQLIDLNNEGTMAPINSSNSLFCIDFVADAFQEFQDNFENYARSNGGINLPDKRFEISAVQAYSSALKKYNDHTKELIEFFVESHLQPIQEKIVTVNDLAAELLRFVRNYANLHTITYSSFILSTKCSHFTTGLSIDIMDHDYGDDSAKNDIFLSDDYEAYSLIAARSGFKINLNAPWNLIANLSSRAIKKHMNSYDLDSLEQFFEQYYIEAYALDLTKLREFIFQSFYEFVETYPDVVKKKYCKDGSLDKILLVERESPSSLVDLESELEEELLVDIYLSSRYNENASLRMLDAQFDEIREKALYTLSESGTLEAFKFLGRTFTDLDSRLVKIKRDSGLTSETELGTITEPEGTAISRLDYRDASYEETPEASTGVFPGDDGVDDNDY